MDGEPIEILPGHRSVPTSVLRRERNLILQAVKDYFEARRNRGSPDGVHGVQETERALYDLSKMELSPTPINEMTGVMASDIVRGFGVIGNALKLSSSMVGFYPKCQPACVRAWRIKDGLQEILPGKADGTFEMPADWLQVASSIWIETEGKPGEFVLLARISADDGIAPTDQYCKACDRVPMAPLVDNECPDCRH